MRASEINNFLAEFERDMAAIDDPLPPAGREQTEMVDELSARLAEIEEEL